MIIYQRQNPLKPNYSSDFCFQQPCIVTDHFYSSASAPNAHRIISSRCLHYYLTLKQFINETANISDINPVI